MKTKVVLLPIKVSAGLYCWGGPNDVMCDHFENWGGHPTCKFKLGKPKYIRDGVYKPDKCLKLKEEV